MQTVINVCPVYSVSGNKAYTNKEIEKVYFNSRHTARQQKNLIKHNG